MCKEKTNTEAFEKPKNSFSWTPEQRVAIDLRPQKLLVSAAAGSGKTAVLTQRIISEITDTENDADISRFLVVTYTRMAAAELKARISEAIRRAASESPDNKKLARQLLQLGSAKISTIHGFCSELVKRYWNRLGLPASVKVCEETQALEIRNRIMDALIERAYSGAFSPIPDFRAFSDNFVTTRDHSLSETFLSLYNNVIRLPNGFKVWEDAANHLKSPIPFGKTEWGGIAMLLLRRASSYRLPIYLEYRDLLASEPAYLKNYIPAIDADIELIKKLAAFAENSEFHKAAACLAGFEFTALSSVGAKNKLPEGEFFKNHIRAAFKKDIELLSKAFASPDEPYADITKLNEADGAKMLEMRRRTADISLSLIAFLREFDLLYSQEKQRLGILDFGDLEQYTYRLLYYENGDFTPLSKEVSASFDEVFVDEFQDINPMQSSIFAALAQKARIFQVGDIKQSIYGFRGAEPSIFAGCRRSYTEYSIHNPPSDAENALTVFLSANFRSAYPVTAFVNRIFDVLFHTPENYPGAEERIPYSADDRLICSKENEPAPPVEIMLINVKTKKQEDDPVSGEEAEAEAVARRIIELHESGVKYGDITVLSRSIDTTLPLENKLKSYGIPTVNQSGGAALSDAPEVLLALSLLNCIDNPHRDVHLAGALRSPIFGFTMDELVTIRDQYGKNGSLYSALCDYTEKNNLQKGRKFIDFIDRMRLFSMGETAARVLWQIYTETEFFSLVYDGGAVSESVASARRANLVKLHSLASDKSTVGGDGIYAFLKSFQKLAESKDAPTAAVSASSDSILFLNFHKSKGLEFPHCFIYGTSHARNVKDKGRDLVCSDDLGIATRLRDETGIIKYDTPIRRLLAERRDYRQFEEELRVLYVALTRAKSALYISAFDTDTSALTDEARAHAKHPHPYTFYRLSSPIEWILSALYSELPNCTVFPEKYLKITHIPPFERDENGFIVSSITAEEVFKNKPHTESAPSKPSDAEINSLLPILSAKLSFSYPFSADTSLPAKVSVSRLYPSMLDDLSDSPVTVREKSDTPSESDNSEMLSELDEAQIEFIPAKEEAFPENEQEASEPGQKNKNKLLVPVFLSEQEDNSDSLRVRISREEKSAELPIISDPPEFIPRNPENGDLEKCAAEIGTATHLFMQFCDFASVAEKGIPAEIKRLVDKQFILPYHAALIDTDALSGFFGSQCFKEMCNAQSLHREVRFNTRMSASLFTEKPEYAKRLENETILVQGVIDCYYVNGKGETVLLDYKTDRFPSDWSEAKISAVLRKRHRLQLFYYKTALERLLLRPVDRTLIYSFALNKAIPLFFKT